MEEPKVIKTLPKKHFTEWLKKISNHSIIAPVRRENYSEFSRIKKISEIDLTSRNTIISPKGLILSQTLNMFDFDLGREPLEVKSSLEDAKSTKHPKQLILGIRPCDTHGFTALDYTFDGEFKDQYYLSLREQTILVGLACNDLDVNCFCTSVGGGPHDSSGMDILMADLGNSYLFNIYTKRGESLIEPCPELFSDATEEQTEETKRLRERVEAKPTRKMETAEISKKLGAMFEDDYWTHVAKKCLGCGICTYLCPTCYCFDITDEKWGSKGERVRTWDSCMYPEYTIHASGYNPRPARMNRLRNRFYHKFRYYPELYDSFGCTGCGRCIRHCPVNIDIIDIINGVKDVKIEGEV